MDIKELETDFVQIFKDQNILIEDLNSVGIVQCDKNQ
jgi:hypothetical protein